MEKNSVRAGSSHCRAVCVQTLQKNDLLTHSELWDRFISLLLIYPGQFIDPTGLKLWLALLSPQDVFSFFTHSTEDPG